MVMYTVSFFGHREVDNASMAMERLEVIVRYLIRNREYTEFLVGRDGEFDILTSSVIRQITKAYDYEKSVHVLVLPYMRADFKDNEKSYLNYYDDVEICEQSAKAHYMSAIQIRNRCMVDRSDLVVCYVERKNGGAYGTMKYAVRQQKRVLNIAIDKEYEDYVDSIENYNNFY